VIRSPLAVFGFITTGSRAGSLGRRSGSSVAAGPPRSGAGQQMPPEGQPQPGLLGKVQSCCLRKSPPRGTIRTWSGWRKWDMHGIEQVDAVCRRTIRQLRSGPQRHRPCRQTGARPVRGRRQQPGAQVRVPSGQSRRGGKAPQGSRPRVPNGRNSAQQNTALIVEGEDVHEHLRAAGGATRHACMPWGFPGIGRDAIPLPARRSVPTSQVRLIHHTTKDGTGGWAMGRPPVLAAAGRS